MQATDARAGAGMRHVDKCHMPCRAVLFAICCGSASATPISTVRLGGLFPRFRTAASGYSKDNSGIRRFVAFVQAIQEINNKTDGVADHLLPNTRIAFTQRDSKRDGATAFFEARALVTQAFGGQGVDAIVGAASSGPSALAALALAETATPQISYSSTSPTLSEGSMYPFFARTPPSDAFQAAALADLAFHHFNYTRIATVASTDTYGSSGIRAFTEQANALGMTILTSISVVASSLDYSEQFAQLRRSGARVILIFCGTFDASRFIEHAYDAGIGGPGYLWLGSDAVSNHETMSMVADDARRQRIFQGFVGLTPATLAGSAAYEAYERRRRALRSTVGNGTGACDLEVDDDAQLMWAADHDGNASTPLECAGSDHQVDGTYAPYSYDATFALAHALHQLVEVRRRHAIDGRELFSVLLGNVSFEGVTGRVEFNDASSDPSRQAHGDRRVGVQYHVMNFGASGALEVVGAWQPCRSLVACDFGERFVTSAPFTFSTADGYKPHDGSEVGLLMRLEDERVEGGLGDGPKIAACAALLAAKHANERNGSIVPELAHGVDQSFHLVPRPINIRADAATAIGSYLGVRSRIDAFADGAASRTNVHLAQLGAIDGVPQLSYYSSSPDLSDAKYSFFGRTFVSDATSASVLAAQLASFGWSNFGVLHVRDEWASAFSEHLAQNAFALGLTHHSASWTETDASEMEQAVRMIDESHVNVIVFLCFSVDIGRFLRIASAAGLLSPGYAWITIEGEVNAAQADTDETLAQLMSGMLSFEANPVPSPGFQRLAAVWSSLGPAECNASGAAGVFDVPPSVFDQPPSLYAAFAYDAVAAIALALQASDNPHDGNEVLGAVSALRFDGATGPVAFDSAHDRQPSGLMYTFTRFVDRAPSSSSARRLTQRICRVLTGDGVDVTADMTAGAVTAVPLLFRDGSARPPEDAIVARQRALDEQTAHQRRLIVALTSAFGALLLVLFAMMHSSSRKLHEFKRREIAAKQVRARPAEVLRSALRLLSARVGLASRRCSRPSAACAASTTRACSSRRATSWNKAGWSSTRSCARRASSSSMTRRSKSSTSTSSSSPSQAAALEPAPISLQSRSALLLWPSSAEPRAAPSPATALLRRCCDAATALLRRCYDAATALLRRCYVAATALLRRCTALER